MKGNAASPPCTSSHLPPPPPSHALHYRSVTLLDCFTIPMTVLLSAALLGATYRRGHYAGAAICVAGLALLVLTDRGSGGSGGAGGGGGGGISGAVLLGDSLVLLGASLYAVSNVLQEWLLGRCCRCCCRCCCCCGWTAVASSSPDGRGCSAARDLNPLHPDSSLRVCFHPPPPHPHPTPPPGAAGDVSVHELLGCLGAWGCLWGLAQGLPLELHTLLGASWTPAALLPFLGFGAAMFAFYRWGARACLWGTRRPHLLLALSGDCA